MGPDRPCSLAGVCHTSLLGSSSSVTASASWLLSERMETQPPWACFLNMSGASPYPICINDILKQRVEGIAPYLSSSLVHTTFHLWSFFAPRPHPHPLEATTERMGLPPLPPQPPCTPQVPRRLKPRAFSCHPGRCPVQIRSPAAERESMSLGLPLLVDTCLLSVSVTTVSDEPLR